MPSTQQFTVWWRPGSTIYGVLASIGGVSNGEVWNGSSLVSPTLGGWSTYVIPCTQQPPPANYCPGEYNLVPYTASFPTGNTTPGYYTFSPRIQTGAAPDYQFDMPIPYGAMNQLCVNWNGSDCIPLTTGTSAFVSNSLLCGQADLANEFGLNNILQWSDLNGTGTEDVAREFLMVIRASTWINGFFNGGNRQVLESINDQFTVTRWCAVIAGCYLYASRGAELDAPGLFGQRGGMKLMGNEYGRYQSRYDSVLNEMGEYKIGYQVAAGGMRNFPRYGSSDPVPIPAGDIVTGWVRWP